MQSLAWLFSWDPRNACMSRRRAAGGAGAKSGVKPSILPMIAVVMARRGRRCVIRSAGSAADRPARPDGRTSSQECACRGRSDRNSPGDSRTGSHPRSALQARMSAGRTASARRLRARCRRLRTERRRAKLQLLSQISPTDIRFDLHVEKRCPFPRGRPHAPHGGCQKRCRQRGSNRARTPRQKNSAPLLRTQRRKVGSKR